MNRILPDADTVPWKIAATLVVNEATRLEASFAETVSAFANLSTVEQARAEIRFTFQRERGRIGGEVIKHYLKLLAVGH